MEDEVQKLLKILTEIEKDIETTRRKIGQLSSGSATFVQWKRRLTGKIRILEEKHASFARDLEELFEGDF